MSALRENFAYWRSRGKDADMALAMARDDLAKGNRHYGACSPHIVYNPRNAKGEGWVENVTDGLRFVDYADKVCRYIDHTGWFTDDDQQGELYRGAVWRLPHGRFVGGYNDPNVDGSALIDFSDIFTCEKEAARRGDRLAEIHAEHERDYERAFQAGTRWHDLGEERKTLSSNTLALVRELKALPRNVGEAVRDTCLNTIERNLRDRQKLFEEREELFASYHCEDAFQEGAQL